MCPFCDMAFKWNNEMLKHCLTKHFQDEIKAELPEEYPGKCPLCEYIGKSRTVLAIHYGITHKVSAIKNRVKRQFFLIDFTYFRSF